MSKPESESCFLIFLMSMLGPAMGHAVPHDHGDTSKHDIRLMADAALRESLRWRSTAWGKPAAGQPLPRFTGCQGLRLLLIIPKEETEDNSA